MSPQNIQISDGNFSRGPVSGFLYTVSFSLKALLQVEEGDGSVAATFPVTRSQLRNPIKELHYDGTHFWTLENLPSSLGVVIKKWRLFPFPFFPFPNLTPSEFRWQDEITLLNRPNVKWSVSAFFVEHYHSSLAFTASSGTTSIELDDASNFNIGDTIYLGPSTFSSSTGAEVQKIITGKSGDTLFFSGGLNDAFQNTDPVDVTQAVWVFNDHSFSGDADNAGRLIKFDYPEKDQAQTDSGAKYSGVTAADFDSTFISFIRGAQLLRLDLTNTGDSFNLDSSIEANLIESDQTTPITVFDLIAELSSSRYLKLQRKETTETGALSTITFDDDKFSFQELLIPTFTNSISLNFDTRQIRPQPSADTIEVTASVLDQFGFPLPNKTVQFTTTEPGASFSPTQDITNASGIATTTFTPSSDLDTFFVTIKAEVVGGTTVREELETNIIQLGKITTNPDGLSPDTSRPIEQLPQPFLKTFEPIEQRLRLKTQNTGGGMPVELSNPIEQVGIIKFGPSPINNTEDSIIEQRLPETDENFSKPLEQLDFDFSFNNVQQFELKTDASFSKPAEQQDPGSPFASTDPDALITVTQFNFTELVLPPCGSEKNPVDTNILWRIRDNGFAFDTSSIIFTVNGIQVQNLSGFSVSALAAGPPFGTAGLEIAFNPAEDFDFDSTVEVTLQITNTAAPPVTFNYRCLWTTTPDTKPPVFSNIEPECDSTAVSSTAPIEFDVVDVGAGVDPDSIVLTVEGIVVCSGLSLEPISTASGSGFHVVYNHIDDPFRFGSTVTIGIQATDLTVDKNASQFICCFDVEESSAPIFTNLDPETCETFVDNITGFTFEVYGVRDGIDISTLEVRVDNKQRKVFVRPRLLRAQ